MFQNLGFLVVYDGPPHNMAREKAKRGSKFVTCPKSGQSPDMQPLGCSRNAPAGWSGKARRLRFEHSLALLREALGKLWLDRVLLATGYPKRQSLIQC